jgi:hypothetical protein
VPLGGRVPITVTADRRLGYQGAIDLEIAGLPSGVRASPATILTGQDSTVVTLEAVNNAAEGAAAPFKIVGRARVEGHELVRAADGDDPLRVAFLIPPPDLLISTEPREITLTPGNEATFTVKIARRNGFRGRVPCRILNLPPGVFVEAVGLNGVLVNEDESSRTIKLRAEDWVRPTEQPLYAVGTVESVSPTEHASGPLNLKVRAKTAPAAGTKVSIEVNPKWINLKVMIPPKVRKNLVHQFSRFETRGN